MSIEFAAGFSQVSKKGYHQMTIRITKKTFADKLLAIMGKKRAVWIPADVYKRFGPYVIVQAKRESFWNALTRPNGQDPPEGWFYNLE